MNTLKVTPRDKWGWGRGGKGEEKVKSSSRRARLPSASVTQDLLGVLFGKFTKRARPFFSQQDPSSNTGSEPADVSPDTFPPLAASQPFANEGTAAGYWETDGSPHLHGFDLEALALQVQALPEKQLHSGKGTDSQQQGLQRAAGSGLLGEVPLKSEGTGSLFSGQGSSPAGWAPAGPREAGQATGITFLQ